MLKFVVLGIIQGLTEFFPVSSSAHLVIAQKILRINQNGLALSIILHLGTVLALITFFFKDIIAAFKDSRTLIMISTVTLFTGIIGILGKDFFEALFISVKYIALALFCTGIILILTKKFMQNKRSEINLKDSIILGIMQGVAIIPGISRSGITVSTLLFRGFDKEKSFRFSFLASIPAILGATILESRKIGVSLSGNFLNFTVGFVFSFLSGLTSLWILKSVIGKAKLFYFGYYCIIAAILTLIFIK